MNECKFVLFTLNIKNWEHPRLVRICIYVWLRIYFKAILDSITSHITTVSWSYAELYRVLSVTHGLSFIVFCCSLVCFVYIIFWGGSFHYDDVRMSPMASQINSLTTRPFIQAQIKENIKAPRHWPLSGEFSGDRWIPSTKASNKENVSIWLRHHVNWLFIFIKAHQLTLRWGLLCHFPTFHHFTRYSKS